MQSTKAIAKPNKDAFKRYLEIQKSGVTNMFDSRIVCELANITKDEHIYIIKNYSALVNEYNLSMEDIEYD